MTLIAFEGLDHSGKSTQIKLLLEYLNKADIKAISMRFPCMIKLSLVIARETASGQLLDAILQGKTHLQSAQAGSIQAEEAKGNVVILDRYKASGMAYSMAQGLDYNWCLSAESGLPEPDLTIYLEVKPEETQRRHGYGDEIYDSGVFQASVAKSYLQLISKSSWVTIDGSRAPSDIHEHIVAELKSRKILTK